MQHQVNQRFYISTEVDEMSVNLELFVDPKKQIIPYPEDDFRFFVWCKILTCNDFFYFVESIVNITIKVDNADIKEVVAIKKLFAMIVEYRSL